MMVLETYESQLKFLQKCYDHIQRIDKSIFSEIEVSSSGIEYQLIQDLHRHKLPVKIISPNELSNTKTAKLYILTNIYNATYTEMIRGSKALDLKTVFSNVKRDTLNKINVAHNCSPEELMTEHRASGILHSILNLFFEPKSASFLRGYGFFKSENNTKSDERPQSSNTKKI